jgi:hypothetical protein
VVPLESQDSLGMTDFTFSSLVNEQPFLNAATIKGGECWISPESYPILQPNGSQTVVQVHENPVPGAYVSDITYTGSGTPIGVNLCSGDIVYLLGPGVNITTFTNRKGTPPFACE